MSDETLGQRVARDWFSKAPDVGGGRADLAPLVDREVEHLSMDLGNTKFQRDQLREQLAAMTEQRDKFRNDADAAFWRGFGKAVEQRNEAIVLLRNLCNGTTPLQTEFAPARGYLATLDEPQDPAKAWAEELNATTRTTDAPQMSKGSMILAETDAGTEPSEAIPPDDGAQQAGHPNYSATGDIELALCLNCGATMPPEPLDDLEPDPEMAVAFTPASGARQAGQPAKWEPPECFKIMRDAATGHPWPNDFSSFTNVEHLLREGAKAKAQNAELVAMLDQIDKDRFRDITYLGGDAYELIRPDYLDAAHALLASLRGGEKL